MPRCDALTATLHGLDPEPVLLSLRESFPASDLAPVRPFHGWAAAYELRSVSSGRVHCRLSWEGNPGVNVEVTGEDSPEVLQAARNLAVPRPGAPVPVELRVSRRDTCIDVVRPGFADDLFAYALRFVDAYQERTGKRLSIDARGDWHRNEARSLYLGARSSEHRLVIYEKGYEQRARRVDPHAPTEWVRLETRWRPSTRSKARAATVPDRQAMAPTRWIADLLRPLALAAIEDPPSRTAPARSELEVRLLHLARQWLPTLREGLAETGSPEKLLQLLEDLHATGAATPDRAVPRTPA